MKKLLTILLTTVTTSVLAQTEVSELYIKLIDNGMTVDCKLQPADLEFTKKRIHLTTPYLDLNLKIKKRKKKVWYGQTPDGCRYEVVGYIDREKQVFGLFLIKGNKIIEVSNKDLCQ